MSPQLSFLEARVLGVLVEKQRTVPDTYPLSINSLVAGCNQKTSRDPVIEASESDIVTAIDQLRTHHFIIESSGGRVARYGHNMERVLQIPSQSAAILTVLMLRGPQTPGELRQHCERLHRFADISTVEAFLSELAERSSGSLVMELPRQPGARENRWAHLLCGTPDIPDTPVGQVGGGNGGELALLREEVRDLRQEITALRATVTRLCQELGVTQDA